MPQPYRAAAGTDDLVKSLEDAIANPNISTERRARARRALAALKDQPAEKSTSQMAAELRAMVNDAQITAQVARRVADFYAASHNDAAPSAYDAEQAKLDAKMGITAKGYTLGVRMNGAIQEFGIMVPIVERDAR